MTVCSYGSGLLFALHAGVVGDRFNRKLVMVTADVGRALLMGLLAWQVVAGDASLVLMCLIALSVVFDSAAAAALPDLVGEKLFARAMARNQSRDFTLAMIGPVLGAARCSRSARHGPSPPTPAATWCRRRCWPSSRPS